VFNFLFRSHYVRQADFAAEELEEEIERVLAQQAKETCQMLVEGKYQVISWPIGLKPPSVSFEP